MKNASLNTNGKLQVTPSETSSENDFDFLVGEFEVYHKKLKSRLNNCNDWIETFGTHKLEKLLGGFGNIEQHKICLLYTSPSPRD